MKKKSLFEYISLIVIITLFSPIFLIYFVYNFFSSSKCKHHKVCPWYSDQSVTCMKNSGRYDSDKFAGCYIDMEQKHGSLNR